MFDIICKTTVIALLRTLELMATWSFVSTIEFPIILNILKSNKNYKKLLNLSSEEKTSKSIEELKIKIVDEVIDDLIPILKKLIDYTDLSNMKTIYNNIDTLTVKQNKKLYFMGCTGSYDIKTNQIDYADKKSLTHKFLHLASSYFDKKNNIRYVGFSIHTNRGKSIFINKIGDGLNEGYTSLLDARIYNNGKADTYLKEVRICKLLEKFFDNPDDMEKYYFNHDLRGLLNYLKKFTSYDNLVGLVRDVDGMLSCSYYLSQAPTYYYIKSLKRIYEMSLSKELPDRKRKKLSDMLEENFFMRNYMNNNKFALKRQKRYVGEEKIKKLYKK